MARSAPRRHRVALGTHELTLMSYERRSGRHHCPVSASCFQSGPAPTWLPLGEHNPRHSDRSETLVIHHFGRREDLKEPRAVR